MKNKYNKVYHYVFIHQKVVREIIKVSEPKRRHIKTPAHT